MLPEGGAGRETAQPPAKEQRSRRSSGAVVRLRAKVVVISNEKGNALISAWVDLSSLPVEVELVGENFEDALRVAEEYQAAADVFVSGASIAPLLRERFAVPIVAIKPDGFDVLRAVLEAHTASTNPNGEVVLMAYGSRLPVIDHLREVSRLNVRQVVYQSLSEIRPRVERLAAEGVRAIVGPTLPCLMAENLGMASFTIYSRQTFQEAFAQAIHLATLQRSEKEHAKRLRTIVDFAHCGIVATDEKGKVTLCNPSGSRILGRAAEKITGQELDTLFPGSSFADVMIGSTPQVNQVVRAGATECIASCLPIHVDGQLSGMVLTFHESKEITLAEHELRKARTGRKFSAKYTLSDIVGSSHAIRYAVAKAATFARGESNVLIVGETGTGKELFAQGIHNASPRREGPFVAVNCASLPETLLESELFGYEEGAFTGARKGGKPGLLELAHGGTLFLDEVGDLPLTVQVRLLRVLQEKEVLRIAGTSPIPLSIRVIAATNRDLSADLREGRFRRDLFYRLDVLHLEVPPLRERPEDIPLLLEYFLKNRQPLPWDKMKWAIARILPQLQCYSWPGNVRQLQALAERLSLLASSDTLDLMSLSEPINEILSERAPPYVSLQEQRRDRWLRSWTARQVDVQMIRDTLSHTAGNRTQAARYLGISRTTLWRRLKQGDSRTGEAANLVPLDSADLQDLVSQRDRG